MVDKTLASNAFTAYVPHFGGIDKLTHLGDSTLGSAWRGLKGLFSAKPAVAFDGVRPPGDVAPDEGGDLRQIGGSQVGGLRADNLQRASTATMGSHETWRDLPQLPVDQASDVERYFHCTNLAAGPQPGYADRNQSLRGLQAISPNMRDAFFESVEGRDGISRDVLPALVLELSLVNASAGDFAHELAGVTSNPPKAGELRYGVMSHLSDPKTGFSAGITFDPDRREVVIGFSGLGTSKMTTRQVFRTAMNWLGFIPKTMSQASKLTQLVKAHIDQVNQTLPEGQKLKLTLTGHSMGGGLASYAALRNQVPAVVTNPMRLGWGARAGRPVAPARGRQIPDRGRRPGRLGRRQSRGQAHLPLVPAFNVRGPLGHARRFMLPRGGNQDPHNDLPGVLRSMKDQDRRVREMAPTTLPYLQRTNPLAHGQMLAGNVAPAVNDAVRQGIRDHRLQISNREANTISRLVQSLVSGRGDATETREALKDAIDKVRSRNHISPATLAERTLPPILHAIEQDFVTGPQSRQNQDGGRDRVRGDAKLDKLLG